MPDAHVLAGGRIVWQHLQRECPVDGLIGAVSDAENQPHRDHQQQVRMQRQEDKADCSPSHDPACQADDGNDAVVVGEPRTQQAGRDRQHHADTKQPIQETGRMTNAYHVLQVVQHEGED